MDINAALHEIIFKYQLDRYYPHYRNMYHAEKILTDVLEGIIQNRERVVFVGDNEIEIKFIRDRIINYDDIHFCLFKRRSMTFSQLEKVAWEKYDRVYLLSFYGAEHAERWLRLHNIQYEWIYDVFEREGVFLEREFWAFGKEHLFTLFDAKNEQGTISPYVGSTQGELYCQQNKYNSTRDDKTKRIALERCLFLTIYMKNFIAAREYAELLMKSEERYRYMWEEIENLLGEIRRLLNDRKQEDIVLYWLDALPYGGEQEMPYLQNAVKKCVKFENAFTYIGYTNSTLRAMFLGKKDIDDRVYNITGITKENSPVIRILEEQGFDLKVCSSEISDFFQSQYRGKQTTLDWMVPASMEYWDMISGMLTQEQKTLWLVQTLDAHLPCLNRKMNDHDYADKKKRQRLAKQELDAQLSFYDAMINKNITRIYMSDHGNEAIYKYHTLFNVYRKGLEAGKIEGLFSLLDFKTVLKQLISGGDINEKELTREYVEIGELDWYSFGKIEKVFRNKSGLNQYFFGHKGIIDKDYIYIRYTTGKEYLHKRNDALLCEPLLFYDCEDDVCEPELLPKYRELAGEYPQDMFTDGKFKYSGYIHALYRNISRNNDMKKRIDRINRMLENYPEGSIGIRMGGLTSAILYQILSKENRKKIWGFFDNNEGCLCSKLHLPVLAADQIGKPETACVKAILIPSYVYLETTRKESETWPADIDVWISMITWKKTG